MTVVTTQNIIGYLVDWYRKDILSTVVSVNPVVSTCIWATSVPISGKSIKADAGENPGRIFLTGAESVAVVGNVTTNPVCYERADDSIAGIPVMTNTIPGVSLGISSAFCVRTAHHITTNVRIRRWNCEKISR